MKQKNRILASVLLLVPVICLSMTTSMVHGNGHVPGAYVDIKPGSWPNPINIRAKGVFAAAICGTATLDVSTIDPTTVKIYIDGILEGVAPEWWSYEDAATPYTGPRPGGHTLTGDGFTDLLFHFRVQSVVIGLNLAVHQGETVTLYIRGNLYPTYGGKPLEAADYMRVIDLPGDVNSDAIVNIPDGTIVGLAWGTSVPEESVNVLGKGELYTAEFDTPAVWDERADVNDDHEVNVLDAVIVSLYWNQTQ